MEWERYSLARNDSDLDYEFYSEGPKGKIKKAIRFRQLDDLGKNVFNLAFGDLDEETNKVDDTAVSNNGDQVKILHTVASAVVEFLKLRPSAIILIKGSTSSRTRLYQMKIAAFWSLISQQFEILGEVEKVWLPFKAGVNYKRFLIFKKIS